MVPDAPVLYSFRRCPYAMRARMALSVAEIQCRLREVVLREKPPEMIAASPKGTVPVLVQTDGPVIEESLEVMLWALQQHDPEGWLSPDSGTIEDMLALIKTFDGPFKRALDRYKYPNRFPKALLARQDPKVTASQYLEQLETRLSETEFLFGNRASLADMAIFPFIRQFANTDRAWFDVQPWPKLQTWLQAQLDSSRFTSIMAKYPQWKTGDPEAAFPPSEANS